MRIGPSVSHSIEERTLGEPRPQTLGDPMAAILGRYQARDEPDTVPEEGGEYGTSPYGLERYGGVSPGVATADNDYAITLETPWGDQTELLPQADADSHDRVFEFNATVNHSAVSPWSARVAKDSSGPGGNDLDLEAHRYGSRAWVTFDGRVVFVGHVDTIDTSSSDVHATISGSGPLSAIDEGSYDRQYAGIEAWRAIRAAFEEFAPDWEIHVERPPSPIIIEDFEASGTGLDIVQALHDEYNFYFSADLSRFNRVSSFKPGQIVRQASWTVLDDSRTASTSEYHNAAKIRGARTSSGGRYSAYAEDDAEIERLMQTHDISREEATFVFADDDRSLESDDECEARAQARVSEGVGGDEVTGSIDVPPRLLQPGAAYSLHWDDEARAGPYSVFFDGGSSSYVAVPASVYHGLTDAATICLWVRSPDWEVDRNDRRILGAISGDGNARIRSGRALSLPLHLSLSSGADLAASAYPGTSGPGPDSNPKPAPPADEWTMLQYGWEYDADADETTLYAGHDGEWLSEATASGAVVAPDDVVWFGRQGQRRFYGSIAQAIFYRRRLPASRLDPMAQLTGITGDYVRSLYAFDEGPHAPSSRVYDRYGGQHGTNRGARYQGSPQVLHDVDFSHSTGDMSTQLNFSQNRDYAGEIERNKRRIDRLNRRL